MADITFVEQSAAWLRELQARKRKPISPATLRTFSTYVRRLLPLVGPDTGLEKINNGVAKQVVAKLCDQELAPKTVSEILTTLKAVVASATDSETGEQLFPRSWSAKHIDCPTIGKQHQPSLTERALQESIRDSGSDQECVLYSLLAGSGLRISECLAIHVRGTDEQTSWNRETATISVRATMFNGRELQRVKTPAAVREVDLDTRLNHLLEQFVAAHNVLPGQFLLQARTGRALHLKTARERLAKHKIPGFHCFRRYRITRLREIGVREDLIRYWVGHEGENTTDLYSKLAENVELRRKWVLRAGLGFQIPELCKVGHPAQASSKARKVPQASAPTTPAESPAPVESTAVIEPVASVAATAYVAQDSDLDDFFHSTPSPQLEHEEV